jgi:Protein of unknown function (DUF1353)
MKRMQDIKLFMQAALAPLKPFDGQPAPIVPFADWDYYYITSNIEWRSNDDPSLIVTVPKGFVTDLASVPSVFWSLLPPTARYSYPAIIHDYLYWYQPYDRGKADNILKDAMQDLNVPAATVVAVFSAVRFAGGIAWAKNAAAKANGERRVLKTFPINFTTTWATWRERRDVFACQDKSTVERKL